MFVGPRSVKSRTEVFPPSVTIWNEPDSVNTLYHFPLSVFGQDCFQGCDHKPSKPRTQEAQDICESKPNGTDFNICEASVTITPNTFVGTPESSSNKSPGETL